MKINTRQFAGLAGVSQHQVAVWRKLGIGPQPIRYTPTSMRLYDREEVSDWVSAGEQEWSRQAQLQADERKPDLGKLDKLNSLQAAEYLGIKVTRLYQWKCRSAKTGIHVGPRFFQSSPARYRKTDLDRWRLK